MSDAHATLIYDGNCGFCRRWTARLHVCDRRGLIALVPYQAPDLETRFPGVSRAECTQRMHLVDAAGGIHRGAAAGREVLRRLPGGRLWTVPFRLPGGLRIAERAYVWITHRWGPLGREDSSPACDTKLAP